MTALPPHVQALQNHPQARLSLKEQFDQYEQFGRKTWRELHATLGAAATGLLGSNASIDGYIARVLMGLSDHTDQEFDLDLREQALWILRWTACGAPRFTLTESLAAGLVLHDCGKTPSAEVVWPFEAFLVVLPYPKSPLVAESIQGERMPVHYVMAHRYHGFPGIYKSSPDDEAQSWRSWRAVQRALGALANGKLEPYHAAMDEARAEFPTVEQTCLRMMLPNGCGVFQRVPYAAPTERIGKWFSQRVPNLSSEEIVKLSECDQKALTATARLVANLCLYLGERVRREPSLLSPRTPKAPKRPKPSDPPQDPYVTLTLGTEVKLPALAREAARHLAERGATPKWRELQRKIHVRAHTRNQACGPKWSERKKITVGGYSYGPDLFEALGKVYACATPEERSK